MLKRIIDINRTVYEIENLNGYFMNGSIFNVILASYHVE
jgi:hypothetical protein